MQISRTRGFKINMGNYETHTEEMTVVLDLDQENLTFDQAISEADKRLRTGLEASIRRAAEISDVANAYVLTWLEDDVNG